MRRSANVRVLEVTRHGINETNFGDTQHFKLYQSFTFDPEEFIAEAIRNEEQSQYQVRIGLEPAVVDWKNQ